MTFKINPLHATDSYKLGHRKMYPKGTTMVFSNMTPRSDRLFRDLVPAHVYDGKLVHFGLQALVKQMVELWKEEFFSKDADEVCARYARRISTFVGADTVTTDHVRALHKLGSLPISIHALPDGTVTNFKVPVFTVFNDNPDFYWLVNYLETYLSDEYWKPATSATIARYYRRILEKYADETGAPKEFIDWQAHDFSCRGMSGMMDAAMTGSGHLTQFTGTDTLVAVDYVEYFYGISSPETLIGGSVPASEHSVMTMGGPEGELELFRRLIKHEYPNGIVSLVSDSYDFWKVITEYTVALKDDILARGSDALGNSKVVFRPDSGDPVRIIAGYTEDEISRLPDGRIVVKSEPGMFITENEAKGAVQCLWDIFGGTETEKGYKSLSQRVGLIYGDSITMHRADQILSILKEKGFASNNIVFGVGSYTYQYITRDTLGFAVKATYGEVNGEGRMIFKAPKTDSGAKHSARGCVDVEFVGGEYVLVDGMTFTNWDQNGSVSALTTILFSGSPSWSEGIEAVRARARGEK